MFQPAPPLKRELPIHCTKSVKKPGEGQVGNLPHAFALPGHCLRIGAAQRPARFNQTVCRLPGIRKVRGIGPLARETRFRRVSFRGPCVSTALQAGKRRRCGESEPASR
jgi:hypothetical protein